MTNLSHAKAPNVTMLIFAGMIAVALSGIIGWQRDAGFGGPHHDEVIALMASKGLERRFVQISENGQPPLNEITAAANWQEFTKDFSTVPFSEIRADVLAWDKHPPLSFWILNTWLSGIGDGDYSEAVILVWLQIVLASGILALLIFRVTGRAEVAVLGFALFLFGNSSVYTGTWVRQYALFAILFAGVLVVAFELVRRSDNVYQFTACSIVMGLLSLCGMLTQYSFLTMSAPVHAALLIVLAVEKKWTKAGLLLAVYIVAALLFFFLLPGVLEQANAVSEGLEKKSQWLEALGGIPAMYIPVPSTLPRILRHLMGAAGLLMPLVLAFLLLRFSTTHSGSSSRSALIVPLAGMLGAGLLQFILVGLGYFPGWATGPNHMIAFWLLTVFAASVLWAQVQFRGMNILLVGIFIGLLGMQGLYIWNLYRIAPNLNKSYIASLHPELVILDNMARGFVLEITDIMPPEKLVLVTNSQSVEDRFEALALNQYSKILYLPMDETVVEGKDGIISAAKAAGWQATELPVVHHGMYEAVWIEKKASMTGVSDS